MRSRVEQSRACLLALLAMDPLRRGASAAAPLVPPHILCAPAPLLHLHAFSSLEPTGAMSSGDVFFSGPKESASDVVAFWCSVASTLLHLDFAIAATTHASSNCLHRYKIISCVSVFSFVQKIPMFERWCRL